MKKYEIVVFNKTVCNRYTVEAESILVNTEGTGQSLFFIKGEIIAVFPVNAIILLAE